MPAITKASEVGNLAPLGSVGLGADETAKAAEVEAAKAAEVAKAAETAKVTVPTVMLPDGTTIALDDHKIKLGDAEIPMGQVIAQQGEMAKLAQSLETERKELQTYKGQLDEWWRQNGTAKEGGETTKPGAATEADGIIDIEQHNFGENELVLAKNQNMINSKMDQIIEGLNQVNTQVQETQKFTSDQHLDTVLERVSKKYDIPSQELLTEASKLQIDNLEAVGELMSTRKVATAANEQKAADEAKRRADEAAKQTGVGSGAGGGGGDEARRGLPPDAWKNPALITEKYKFFKPSATV